ncbi:MAG TPA: energy-coupling factor transporter transmembrane protein EcfT [Thermotogota bacterium]|nr:energy-coupling factor transporter transmembrane protein EcfT [Thermotogota bacterium]HRW92411.1 energy-coupling factor transporter transmembrane protein EcfT [Thermotogota bacterium]
MIPTFGFGGFVPVDSPVHALDARCKLVAVVVAMVVVFWLGSFATLGILVAMVLVAGWGSRIGFFFLFRPLRSIWFLLLLAFLFSLFSGQGRVLLRWGPFLLYEQGLVRGLLYVLRLVAVVLVSTLFSATTSPVRIADGLEWMMNHVGFRRSFSHETAMILSLAIRFVPVITAEAQHLVDAQRSRGAAFDSGRLLQRLKAFLPVLVPLLLGTFQRAEELALAMDVRGYRGVEGRVKFFQPKAQRRDGFFLVGVLGFFTGLLLLDRFLFT